MSNNQVVIDTLVAKVQALKTEKAKMEEQFDAQIREIENAITVLYGEELCKNSTREPYDDESPTYITGSEDGI